MYQLFVGEIGFDEDKFLYDLCFWKIRSIIRGYRRRTRESWMQTRWHAWAILCSLGAKFDSPEDLLPLSFDKKRKTKEMEEKEKQQLEKLVRECQEFNRQQETKKEAE